MGTKASDRFAIPLCAGHHRAQHARGWKTFEFAKSIDAKGLAQIYWQSWPGRIAWERKPEANDG